METQWFLGISPTIALLFLAICIVIGIGVKLIEPHLVPKSLIDRLERARQVRLRLAVGATVNEIVAELGISVRVVLAIKRRFEIDDARDRAAKRNGAVTVDERPTREAGRR